jgi:hypothetical protein
MRTAQGAAKIATGMLNRGDAAEPSHRSRTAVAILLISLMLAPGLRAAVEPVALHVPDAEAWVGQRLPFYVALRAPGSFAGTASFDLPQLPGTLLIKIGEPVVGSQELEGETWFVQTHEFALFSQRAGTLDVPAFPVRFASRDGFTGPATDVQAQSPGFSVSVRRPPGSAPDSFLITTESLDVTEAWDPAPGTAQVGAIFKRTITQRARQLPGMALAPAPTTAPDGARVYPGEAATSDKLARGEFLGERRETLTYLMQEPGRIELPAITYTWWDPEQQQLESQTLPAVSIEVAPPPATAEDPVGARRAWPWALAAILIAGLSAWQGRRAADWGRRCWGKLNPPDRVAARCLLRACLQNDATAASAAWSAWRRTLGAEFEPDPPLRAAVLGLQRHRFGLPSTNPWQGAELGRAFARHALARNDHRKRRRATALPLLNHQN